MNGSFNSSISLIKPNRKRPLAQVNPNSTRTIQPIHSSSSPDTTGGRKKLSPIYKHKSLRLENLLNERNASSQMYLIGINQVMTGSKFVISPQLNISYKLLSQSVTKSSTPLNDLDKENPFAFKASSSPPVKVVEQSVYMTPEVLQESVVVISSAKLPPSGVIANLSKRLSRGNNGTPTELNITSSAYFTPPSTMDVFSDIEIHDDFAERSAADKTPSGRLFLKIARRMRTAFKKWPKSVSDALDWSNVNLTMATAEANNAKSPDEFRSPVRKRAKFETDAFLTRKPIKSYWVNMDVNTLFRKPLPSYADKYSASVQN